MIGGRQRGCEIRWEWKCWQKCWLAAFVLLKDGKKGLRSPWFPTAFPKVGWGPLNAQFYWSGFRQRTHKKRPGHYRNGLAHFPYSVWYLKYVFSTRDLVLTCQCEHKSSWFHEEVVSFMFFFAYLLFRASSLALMCVPPHWAYLMAMNKKALGLGRFGKWRKWTQIWWFLVTIRWWWRWVLQKPGRVMSEHPISHQARHRRNNTRMSLG